MVDCNQRCCFNRVSIFGYHKSFMLPKQTIKYLHIWITNCNKSALCHMQVHLHLIYCSTLLNHNLICHFMPQFPYHADQQAKNTQWKKLWQLSLYSYTCLIWYINIIMLDYFLTFSGSDQKVGIPVLSQQIKSRQKCGQKERHIL